MTLKKALSPSRIKTFKSCSWIYYCNYELKFPENTNDGAKKGAIAHLVLECLGVEKRRNKVNKILKDSSIKDKAINRLIKKHIYKSKFSLDSSTEEIHKDICMMILRGLSYDFWGERYGTPSETLQEKEFDIIVESEDIKYRIKGLIDRLFIYEDKGVVLIRDFKTNKKKYSGEEITDNLQDNIYTLAIKKLYPHIQHVKMEFVFLRQETEEDMLIKTEAKTTQELSGFEYELTEYQKLIENFSERESQSRLAASIGYPKDGSFSGSLLCGRASSPGEKKKDGTNKWHCPYKFPFTYYSLVDEKGKRVKSSFDKIELELLKKKNWKIEKIKYEGCPAFNKKSSTTDDFSLD